MQKNISRLFAGVMVIVLLSFFAIPASAADSGLVGTVQSFVEWSVNKQDDFANSFWKAIFGDSFNAEDFTPGGKYGGGAGREELQAAYDAYVSDLPASGYDSSGQLRWRLNVRSIVPEVSDYVDLWYSSIGTIYRATFSRKDTRRNSVLQCFLDEFVVPVDGIYTLCTFYNPSAEGCVRLGGTSSGSGVFYLLGHEPLSTISFGSSSFSGYYTREQGKFFAGTTLIPDGAYFSLFINAVSTASYSVDGYWEFICTPISALSGDTYNINTRPTSITGGNYGIVGDNGQITKVEDNSTIINETNNTFYNPATGATVPIVNWSYDYSDRSYKVILESGDTATITYGDENITIQETTVTEGDTITNNYTIYYLVDGSGSVIPPCAHEWAETNTTPATCTVSGSKLLTCSKCQQTKTEPLPVLGHTWQVKQTVTTQYDDTGQLIQEGYTIFECSRCHEQYKSADGTIPPGGSGADPGEDKETLWDKLGKLLGTAVKGILDLLGSAVDVILGGLIDLVTNLFESLKQLVDLFGSVGEAFGVLWTWLPPEIMAILVAGVSIFVFVALLKLFMK